MKSVFLAVWLLCLRLGAAPADGSEYDPALAARLGADERGMRQYVLVLLKKGVGKTTKEEAQTAFRGHFANMLKLAAEGKLVVAGPTEENPQQLEGIFVLNASTLDAAREMLTGDGAVAAKLLEPELYLFYSSAALREIPSIHRRLEKPEKP